MDGRGLERQSERDQSGQLNNHQGFVSGKSDLVRGRGNKAASQAEVELLHRIVITVVKLDNQLSIIL